MKKNILSFLLLLLFVCGYTQNPGQVSYYYKGAKIYFPVSYDRIVIGLKPGNSFSKLRNIVAREINIKADSLEESFGDKQILIKLGRNKVKDITAYVEKLKQIPGLTYARPVFVGTSGKYCSYSEEFILNLKSTTSFEMLQRLMQKTGCTLVRKYPFQDDMFILAAGAKSDYNGLAMANLFYETGLFDYAEPDKVVYDARSTVPNDPFNNLQWSHKNTGSTEQYNGTPGADMKVQEAWAITMGSPTIKIGLIDDGVDLTHPDLQANLLQGFYGGRMTSNPGDGAPIAPFNAHGTNCAGIIAAVANNGIGVAGVAPNCKIIPAVIFGGFFSPVYLGDAAVTASFDFVRRSGADVISNSWNGGPPSSSIDDAIHRAVTLGRGGKGCVVLFSSGNYFAAEPGNLTPPATNVTYPATLPNVIAVGGITMCNQRQSPESCSPENFWGARFGTGLDIVAPCVKIATTDIQGFAGINREDGVEGDYNAAFNGTSAACPNAAGVAALILSVNKELTAKEVYQILASTSDKIPGYNFSPADGQPNGTWNNELGHGRVNALSAVLLAKNCVSPSITSVIAVQPVCPSTFTGSIEINATGESTIEYSIDNGISWTLSNRFNNLPPGNYSVVARMQSSGPNCYKAYKSNPVVISQDLAIVFTAPTVSQPVCPSSLSGSILVNATATGPLEYNLNGGPFQTSNSFTELSPGNYHITARYIASPSCILNYSGNPVVIEQAKPVIVFSTPTVIQPVCPSQLGTIQVKATAAEALEYSLNDGPFQVSNTFNGLTSGKYIIAARFATSPTCLLNFSSNPVTINEPYQSIDKIAYSGAHVRYPDDFFNPTNMNIPLQVNGLFNHISDINFRLDADSSLPIDYFLTAAFRTNFKDLVFTLTSPAGTTVTLINGTNLPLSDAGYSETFSNVVLDDEGGYPTIGSITSVPVTGNFSPANPLSAFNGEDPNGTWILSVGKITPSMGAFARLNRFALQITSSEPCSTIPAMNAGFFEGTITGCSGSPSISPAVQKLYVVGNALSDNIIINTSGYFEISTDPNNGYSASLELTPYAGNVPYTFIYVRSSAAAPLGAIAGDVTISSQDAGFITIGVSGSIITETTWYQDADKDRFGNPDISVNACFTPNGYVADNTDCDDNNRLILTPWSAWYKDADNDGYRDGSGPWEIREKFQCTRPEGYKLVSELLSRTIWDCNDNDKSVYQPVTYYSDNDKDGYGNKYRPMEFCEGAAPAGYSSNNTDCDDNDEAVWQFAIVYIDEDGDGYTAGATEICYGEFFPAGYNLNTLGDDCDDNNIELNPTTVWYKDADNDGYSEGNTLIQCAQPTNYKLATGLTAISGDCNDNNATLNPATVWIRDADIDGYYPGTPVISCTSPGTGYIIRSSQLAGDCMDNNASVNPGAVEVCSNRMDDNCNGVIDEAICYQCQNGTNLISINVTSTSAELNWTAIASPVQWQAQYKTTKQGTKWVDVFVTGNKRSVIISGLLSNQNYQWQLRAKCGKNWTSYATAITFKTSGSASGLTKTAPLLEQTNDAGSAFLKVHPNPTTGFINLDLQLGQGTSVTAMISIMDLRGRRVYAEKTTLVKGLLRKKILLPGNMVSGTYLVEVITNNKSYTSKLVLIR